jgi:hypothetical protein
MSGSLLSAAASVWIIPVFCSAAESTISSRLVAGWEALGSAPDPGALLVQETTSKVETNNDKASLVFIG